MTVTLALAGSAWFPPGTAGAQNAGWFGPSYSGADSVPTGSKAESKLWWNDGSWWGCLWSVDEQSFTIHRLTAPTQTWSDTGVAVDSRPKSRADCLWDGTKLYIASHQYTDGVGGPGHALELYRYSYLPGGRRYSLDVGFPTLIADAKTETLVIDEDSTGTLWAVWRAGARVWIANTLGDDRRWSPATVHPMSRSNLDEDDIAAIVAGGGRIGVLWSNQVLDAFQFTSHEDGAPATAWSPLETVLSGSGLADDDISMRAARDGRVFVALATGTDEVRLEVRSPGGIWSDHRVTTEQDNWSQPVVVLDEETRSVHVFGTSPAALGAIREKVASMDTLVFGAGNGSAVIRDASRAAVGEPSSTKQSVNGATGLVVLASHETLDHYVHHHDTLGGPRPSAPEALFHVDQHDGYLPVTVQCLDASSGKPTSWSWSFGDGATSTQRNPVHSYSQAGVYSVALRVTNELGTDVLTRAGAVHAQAPPPTLVLRPIADSDAYEGTRDTNRGGLGTLRARGGRSSDYRSFVKFFVPPTQGQIGSAELRFGCVSGSVEDGGSFYRIADDWTEPTLTWDNMPDIGGTRLAHFPRVETGETVAIDVGSVVSGSGTVSFGIRSSDFHSVTYSSREGPAPAELQLELFQPLSARPEARFEANRRDGIAPLTVQFFDASCGRVEAWAWDFGDGATSDLQNPSHAFREPGLYAVSLTVTNASGAHTRVGADLVRVGPRVPVSDAVLEDFVPAAWPAAEVPPR